MTDARTARLSSRVLTRAAEVPAQVARLSSRVLVRLGVVEAQVAQMSSRVLVSVAEPPAPPPGPICASAIVTTADDMDISNVIGISRIGGTAQWVEDAASIAKYGRHSWSRFDLPYANDADTPTILAIQLGDRAGRDYHVQAVVLSPLAEADAWPCVLGVDLYDTVFVTRRRGDTVLEELASVIGIDHVMGPAEFVTVLSLGPRLRQTLARYDVDLYDVARYSAA